MKGDVKGLIQPQGDWVAVYAREGDDWTLGTEPVLFWAWLESEDVASFVGIVPFGPRIISATDPMLLGYARADDMIATKFRAAQEALKGAMDRNDGDPDAERECLAAAVRGEPQTFPCSACENGFVPDGGECEVCGGAGVLAADVPTELLIVEEADDPERPN